MHLSGQGLAGPVAVGAGDAILEHPKNAGVALAGSCVNATFEAREFVAHPPRVMPYRVDGLTDLTHNIRELRLVIEAGAPFNFSAGQYAEIEFAPGLSRYYSMASTPTEEKLAFHIRRTPAGKTGSCVAQELKLGDKVKVSGSLGSR